MQLPHFRLDAGNVKIAEDRAELEAARAKAVVAAAELKEGQNKLAAAQAALQTGEQWVVWTIMNLELANLLMFAQESGKVNTVLAVYRQGRAC